MAKLALAEEASVPILEIRGYRLSTKSINPLALLRPRRKPVGMSAVLLPFEESGGVDWR